MQIYNSTNKYLILISLALVLLSTCIPYTQALSGCQRCANTGQCSAAYHNSPGQFCGFFHESGFISKPCCCPLGTICNLSAFECLCHVPNKPYYDDYGSGYQSQDTAGGVIFFLIIICLCVCCCTRCWSDNSQMDYDDAGGEFIPVAVPTSEIPYGSINNPPPTAPLLPSRTRRNNNPRSSGSGSGGGGMGGFGPALGGFVVGEMLGNALGRRDNNHHGHHGRHVRRGFGGGGGFDIRGDTGGGGGRGGHRGGGGGGFDIRGDS